jgi:hypothetical protein
MTFLAVPREKETCVMPYEVANDVTAEDLGGDDSEVLAERTFTCPDGRRARSILYQPKRVDAEMWTCEFRIDGLGTDLFGRCAGGSELDALHTAVDAARTAVASFGASGDWFGAESEDTGIPHAIFGLFGLESSGGGREVKRAVEGARTERPAENVHRRAG